MTDISLDFAGPFTFTNGETSVFRSAYAKSPGIYLWTIRQRSDNSHLIHYVGETLSLGKRHKEHLIHILGLNYGIFHPDKAQDGLCELVWEGLWRDRTPAGPIRTIEAYTNVQEHVLRYLSILNIFFAELHTEDRLRKHIEGCIAWNLRNNHPEHKTLYPDDNHVGRISEKDHGELHINSSEYIRGLDARMPY